MASLCNAVRRPPAAVPADHPISNCFLLRSASAILRALTFSITAKTLSRLPKATASQKYVYPDPIPEFAAAEMHKFEAELREKFAKDKGVFGEDLQTIVDACAKKKQKKHRNVFFQFECWLKNISQMMKRELGRKLCCEYVYPDPIPEFVAAETQKFKAELRKKLAKDEPNYTRNNSNFPPRQKKKQHMNCCCEDGQHAAYKKKVQEEEEEHQCETIPFPTVNKIVCRDFFCQTHAQLHKIFNDVPPEKSGPFGFGWQPFHGGVAPYGRGYGGGPYP